MKEENGKIVCEQCGMKMFDEERQRKEMKLHEPECSGTKKAKEKFDIGDEVKYSDFGLERLDRDQREGEVIGFSEDKEGVRVRWVGNKTGSKFNRAFIKKLEENTEADWR